MRILIVEPGQPPRRADIPHTLRDMQQTVGGYIEIIRPFDDPVALVCYPTVELSSLASYHMAVGSALGLTGGHTQFKVSGCSA